MLSVVSSMTGVNIDDKSFTSKNVFGKRGVVKVAHQEFTYSLIGK